jgi:hypothetical protein
MPQLSQSGRIINLVAVSQGNVYRARPGETTWTAATNTTGDTPPLNYTGVVASASNGQKLYFADGANWVKYDPVANVVSRWSATHGSLPVDGVNNTPRLICNWRGRIVLSGLLYNGQQIFMSAVDDPTDFDYLPADTTPTQAFATTVGPQGAVGDEVTALIPFSDDMLVIGTSQEIHVLQGDPMAGGQFGRMTNAIGIAFGRAFCQSPEGTIFFMSNKVGIFAMVPGQVPQSISQAIDPLLADVNTGTHAVRMAWDDRFKCLHVFVTALAAPAACTHFVWEARVASWFTEEFANNNHNPLAVCEFDGNTADDRSVLMGGWDGYVRTFSRTATTDDGTPIRSEVLLGPVSTKTLEEVMFGDSVCVLGETSNPVTYGILAGNTAEAAAASTAIKTGTWKAGRNQNTPIGRAAHSLYCRLTSNLPWSFEQLRVTVGTRGVVRGRGRG